MFRLTAFLLLFVSLCAEINLPLSLLSDQDRQEELFHYQGQRVSIRGFLFSKGNEEWVLSPEPNLKSCCIGAENKALRQIHLTGDLPGETPHTIATIEGTFFVEPIYNDKGNLSQLYHLRNCTLTECAREPFPIATLALSGLLAGGLGYTLYRRRRP